MKFTRLDVAMKASKKHLTDTESFGTETEDYLVAYLLVITYAEFEQALKKIIHTRLQRMSTDLPAYRYVQSHIKRHVTNFGRIAISNLADTLDRFGGTCKADFYKEVQNQPPHTAWDSIINNRHAVAHPGGQLQMNFNDFEVAYRDSLAVIRSFARNCGLTTAEIGNL